MRKYRFDILVCLFLIVANFAVYHQVSGFGFVNYDDDTYVYENPNVQKGLTGKSVKWALTTTYANFWHPVTWLSYLLDNQLFGLDPGKYHLTSLIIHIINSILLFIAFRFMTGALWCSALVAALFALHPSHVESVAWLSQRKDVLSTLFWILTMLAYGWYVKNPCIKRYITVIICFILGMMAKPMLVTLPCVLLLMDYWPLNRFQFELTNDKAVKSQQWSKAMGLVWEKMPLFVLTIIFSFVAYSAQQKGGAVGSLENYPLGIRVSNALVAYSAYIGKMIWPHNFAVHYPHYKVFSMWQTIGSVIMLTGISAFAILRVRKAPYLIVGWLWYLGTLVPVSGLVQVGSHSMADRYTYVPLIGLFVFISWGVSEFSEKLHFKQIIKTVLVCIVLSALMITSYLQVLHWKDSITLFKHTSKVTHNNLKAYNNLGTAYFSRNKSKEAITSFNKALRIDPEHATVHYNLGLVLLRKGKLEEAIRHYDKVFEFKPDFAKAHKDLGEAMLQKVNFEKAIFHFSMVLKVNPHDGITHNNLGNALSGLGRYKDAAFHYRESLKTLQAYHSYYNLGNALLNQGSLGEATALFAESLRMNPFNPDGHNNMGNALARRGFYKEAVAHYSESLKIKPDNENVKQNLANALHHINKKNSKGKEKAE